MALLFKIEYWVRDILYKIELIFALFLVLAVRNKLLSDRKVQVSLYKR